MSARFLIGDVFERMAELEDGSYDVLITSPPFLALRSYLPDSHPDKHKEIGSEATPAAFLDVMLALTAEWGRLLAPHGSIAVEIGDTYAGSGGAGGDYNENGLREGQARFDGSASRAYGTGAAARPARDMREQNGWPLPKSLAMIPELYAASLAYGRNLLTGEPSPAGRWRVRNFKPWIRSNPPVGALGDKERPATSYITVATRATDRYFDLDNVRTSAAQPAPAGNRSDRRTRVDMAADGKGGAHPAGAPPLDWVVDADLIIDDEIDQRAGKAPSNSNVGSVPKGRTNAAGPLGSDARNEGGQITGGQSIGARGVHIRRRLQAAGILTTPDALDISPKGSKLAHYAVWPPELVKRLLLEMCPRRVCTECGQPSRRITVDRSAFGRQPELAAHIKERREALGITSAEVNGWFGYKEIAKNWERTDKHGAAIPNADDWPLLADRLELDRERFDDLVLGDRRWAESTTDHVQVAATNGPKNGAHTQGASYSHKTAAIRSDLGWSDCGHNTWRPGRVLDPFAGSGTTLAVATGLGFDADGIDIDETNADLARERCGMFLEIIDRTEEVAS